MSAQAVVGLKATTICTALNTSQTAIAFNTTASAVTVLNTVTHNFNPTVFHYFKKSAITRSIVLGSKETALCGFIGATSLPLGTRTIDGKSGSVLCPLCAMLHAELTQRGVK